MTTERQFLANRRNAEHSTGPRTAEGKRRSAQNAISHGLLSRETLLEGEDPEVFADVWDQLLSELQPEGELETYLAGRIIGSVWRMNRVARIEADLFNKPELPRLGGPKNIGEIFRMECREGSGSFLKLLRYETTIDRAFHRSLRTLRSLQAARKKGEAEPGRKRREMAADSPDYETNPMAEASPDYETNPIERQAIPSADFPAAGGAGPGAGSPTDREQARTEGELVVERVVLSPDGSAAPTSRPKTNFRAARKKGEARPPRNGRETAVETAGFPNEPNPAPNEAQRRFPAEFP